MSYYLLGKSVLALPNAVYILSNQHLSGVCELEAAPHFMECVHSFTVLVLSTVGVWQGCALKVILKLFTVKWLLSCRIPEVIFEVGFNETSVNKNQLYIKTEFFYLTELIEEGVDTTSNLAHSFPMHVYLS